MGLLIDLFLAELRHEFLIFIMNRKLNFEVTYSYWPMQQGVLNMYKYSYLYYDVTQVPVTTCMIIDYSL